MFRRVQGARREALVRLRAVLAAGLALGVGAVFTLASWTDSEVAGNSFTASTFATQSSPDGTTFAANPSSPGATLAFGATAVAPLVSNYAFLDIRTTPATTIGGTVRLTSATASGTLAPELEYRAIRTATSTGCALAAFSGSPTYVAGSASTYIAVATVPGTIVASPITSAGGTLRFCFDVRVVSGAANSLQGANATATWQFTTISN
jgi:predicted ribosomally synthesized peptide with SipW-like signal peptide